LEKKYQFKELAKKTQQRMIKKILEITGSFSIPTKTFIVS
jgi:hypothetical protein